MADSIKVLEVGAFQLEAGKTGAGQSPGWGVTGSEETLGASDAFPYLTLGKGKTINTIADNSITSLAFKDVPRQVTQYVEKSLSMYSRFAGLDSFNYWMFGFENLVKTVVAFVITTPSVDPTAGAVYEDADTPTNTMTFMRKEVNASTTYYVFTATDGDIVAGAGGTLTKSSGTGDATLTYTANSGLMYEHLLELDSTSRHFVAYPTAEQITGYSAGDKKNRMATIGVKMGTNDFRYRNAMCKKFGFKSSAGQLAEMSIDFCAYDEGRADYSSSTWTFPATLIDSDNIVAHNQLRVQVGTTAATLVALGVTDVDFSVGVPLQILQDTTSGLYIAEPVMEGKYEIDLATTLSRYSAETYQGYRDAWTTVVGRISAEYGYYMTEFLFQEMKIMEAGPDEGDVAKENLKFSVGYSTTNAWSTWLSGNTILHNGPVVMRVRNANSSNMMFSI